MKDYLAKPKPVSPYEELIANYNGPITQASWGEVGGIPTIIKQQMNPKVRKARQGKFNQRLAS